MASSPHSLHWVTADQLFPNSARGNSKHDWTSWDFVLPLVFWQLGFLRRIPWTFLASGVFAILANLL